MNSTKTPLFRVKLIMEIEAENELAAMKKISGLSDWYKGTGKLLNTTIKKCSNGRSLRYADKFWEAIDWKNKSVEQIANEFGTTRETVTRHRLQLFGPHSPDVYKKEAANHRDTSAWDWAKTDVELGKEHSLTRERVRQIRLDKGLPPSAGGRRQYVVDKIVEALKANPEIISGKTVAQLCGHFQTCAVTMSTALAKAGLSTAKKRIPHKEINWLLPSRDLIRIWKLCSMGNVRIRGGYPNPIWRSYKCKIISIPPHTEAEFHQAIAAEQAKADAFFKQ